MRPDQNHEHGRHGGDGARAIGTPIPQGVQRHAPTLRLPSTSHQDGRAKIRTRSANRKRRTPIAQGRFSLDPTIAYEEPAAGYVYVIMKRWAVGLGAGLLAVGAGVQLQRSFYESPDYEVVADLDGIEIRRYAPRVVAETTVVAETRRLATREGFRRLARFIFGDNETAEGEASKIAMTTPVEASFDGLTQAERTRLDAEPVGRPEERRWRITFTLPSTFTVENAPSPVDARVRVVERPGELRAALRFSGWAERQDLEPLRARLRVAIETSDYAATGPAELAQYDPPMAVLSVFRRNELLVPVVTPGT